MIILKKPLDHTQYVLVDGTRGFTSTVSGIVPTEDLHLSTKNYVDDEVATLSGTIPYNHAESLGLSEDDHTQYSLVDGTRGFTGTVGGVVPSVGTDLTTKGYVDDAITTATGSLTSDHGDLVGLEDDDHLQYLPADGSRPVTGDINFDSNAITSISGIGFDGGQEITWNSTDLTLNIPTGLGPVLQVGQETYIYVYNGTGSQIDNGTAVMSYTAFNGYLSVRPAIANIHEGFAGVVLVATMDIPDGTIGITTQKGKVRDLNTSSWPLGTVLWLSPTVSGSYVGTKPAFPHYAVQIGGVSVSDVSNGIIQLEIKSDATDTTVNFWNGVFREFFDFRTVSSGTTVTGTLVPTNGHDDMTMMFSDGFTMLDTNPAAEILLIPGTDANPQTNYVYVPKSTKVLTVSPSAWPMSEEHIKVAEILLQTAATTATVGALRNQNWNDHIQSATSNQGHLTHIGEAIRRKIPATWVTGVEGVCTIDTGPTPDDVWVSTTAGIVLQLHNHVFEATDTETGYDLHVVNHPITPHIFVSNLNTQLLDASGNSLNNRSFSFVLWGVANKTEEESHLMINLPSDSYGHNSPDFAVNDASNYTVYSIPGQYQGVGFLISRFTYRYRNNDWILYDTEDLRGKIPNVTAGGGAGGTGVTTYLGLSDTPSVYTGHANKAVVVAPGETALEFTSLDQYTLVAGTRAFTGTVSGIEPAEDAHLTTKEYVDTISGSLRTGIDDNATDLSSHSGNSTIHFTWPSVSGTIDHNTIINTHNLTTDIDHDTLTNYAANEHFTESSIDHTAIQNIGTTSHTGIDTFISTTFPTHSGTADAHHNESHTITSHSDTSGTGAELDELTGGGDTALHIHDGRYYTETEIDTLITTVSGGIGALTFLDLTDTPATYSGAVVVYLRVSEETVLSYSPPIGDSVSLTFSDSYIPPAAAATDFSFDEVVIPSSIEYSFVDHGITLGLGDNDHPQYLLTSDFIVYSGTLQDQIGTQTFLDLTDTPATYSGAVGEYLKVVSEEVDDYTVPAYDGVNFVFPVVYTLPNDDDVDFEFFTESVSIGFYDILPDLDALTFLGLTDTPATYSGAAGKYLKVSEETVLSYSPPSGDSVYITFSDSYTPPAGSATDFSFDEVVIPSSIIFYDLLPVKKHVIIKPEEVKLGAPGPVEAVIGNFSVLQFTGMSATQSVYTSFHIPTDWKVGTDVNTRIRWAPVNSSSGTVVWQLTYNAVASEANEVISVSGTTISIADGTQNTQDELLESGNMTISGSGLALEDTMGMTIFRDPSHGLDTYLSSASLVGIKIEYTSDKLGESLP